MRLKLLNEDLWAELDPATLIELGDLERATVSDYIYLFEANSGETYDESDDLKNYDDGDYVVMFNHIASDYSFFRGGNRYWADRIIKVIIDESDNREGYFPSMFLDWKIRQIIEIIHGEDIECPIDFKNNRGNIMMLMCDDNYELIDNHQKYFDIDYQDHCEKLLLRTLELMGKGE